MFILALSAKVLCELGDNAVLVTVTLFAAPFAPFCETFTFELDAVDVEPRGSGPCVA